MRFVGDGYVDGAWMADILKNRRIAPDMPFLRNVYIPGQEDYFHLLLYHCLIQKQVCQQLSTRIDEYFRPNIPTASRVVAEEEMDKAISKEGIANKHEVVWDILTAFLKRKGYDCTCPHDAHVGVFLKRKDAFKNRVKSCSSNDACTKIKLGFNSIPHSDASNCDIQDDDYGN